MFSIGFTFIAAVMAFLSAYYWVRAATAEVPAPEDTSGVGALMGGYLITKNAKGERVDLHGTYIEVAKWNGRAAICSAGAAAFAILAAGAQIAHM
jgi:hypothetical protein